MAKTDYEDLITPAQAARLRKVSAQAIINLLDRGKLPFVEIAGQRFLRTSDVLKYQPGRPGRPVSASKKDEIKE